MKKIVVLLVAVFALGFAANAQEAVGVRLGGGQGYGAELSWQHGLGGNRLEADLGISSGDNYTHFNLTGIYQWTGEIGSGFGWYGGLGLSLGYWSVVNKSDFALAGVLQGGIEYTLSAIPLQFSLDIRPKLWLLPSTDFHWGDIALGIRYKF